MPKKPSAYNKFVKKEFPKFKHLPATEAIKEIAKKWNAK